VISSGKPRATNRLAATRTSKDLAHTRQHRLGVASREALFIELADVRRDTSLSSVEYLNASQVDLFGKGFARSYLHLAHHSQRVI
jgi:hypothetical protein